MLRKKKPNQKADVGNSNNNPPHGNNEIYLADINNTSRIKNPKDSKFGGGNSTQPKPTKPVPSTPNVNKPTQPKPTKPVPSTPNVNKPTRKK